MSARCKILCLSILLPWSVSARAEDLFEQQVLHEAEAFGPEVVQAMQSGKEASNRQDLEDARRSYADAVRRAPEFDHALRRLCGIESAADHLDRAEELCRKALGLRNSPYNVAGLAVALSRSKDSDKLQEAERLLAQARRDTPDESVVYGALFTLESQRNNVVGMREALAESTRTSKDPADVAAQRSLLALNLGLPDADSSLKDEANRLALSAFEAAPNDVGTTLRVAQVALTVDDQELLGKATARLQQLAPLLMATSYFAGIGAAMKGDWAAARAALAHAKERGMDAAEYDSLIARIDDAQPWYERLLPLASRVGVAWLACLLALLVLGNVLSKLTLRVARHLPTRDGQSVGLNRALSRAYSGVISAACVFYYASLPLVLLAVLGSAAAVVLGFMWLGRIPLKLVFVLGLISLVSVWAVLKSVFVRVKDADPGAKLDLATEPRVRALLDEVAAKVGTRAVDSVYLTPGTDVAVFERGSMLHQVRGDSERCLVLGLGVLDGMRLGDFKAVLAHEYGHFSNRDTAGGGLALAVRRSLIHMAQGLAEGGAATWYNPAWWFFRGFFSVFLRVSQGASRLQEVLADRWAAFSYGSEAFVRGLTHVIERSIRFDAQAQAALSPGLEARPALNNLYVHLREANVIEDDIALELQKAFERDPSAYDSHPAPRDRIAWVRALGAPAPSQIDADDRDVWSTFARRRELEELMTHQVNEALGLRPAADAAEPVVVQPSPQEWT